MNWKCRILGHDWEYRAHIYHADHGACFDHINERTCKRCGLEEFGSYAIRGPYPCSDNDFSKQKGDI
jgi:hypothetical protein